MTNVDIKLERDPADVAGRSVASMVEQAHYTFKHSGGDFVRYQKLQTALALQIWEALEDREFANYLLGVSQLFRDATANRTNADKIVRLYESSEIKDVIKKVVDDAHSA